MTTLPVNGLKVAISNISDTEVPKCIIEEKYFMFEEFVWNYLSFIFSSIRIFCCMVVDLRKLFVLENLKFI